MFCLNTTGVASCWRLPMCSTCAFLLESAFLGTQIGLKYSVVTMIGLTPIVVAVAVLAIRDPLFGLAFAYACIFVSEAAYLVGAWMRCSRTAPGSPSRVDLR